MTDASQSAASEGTVPRDAGQSLAMSWVDRWGWCVPMVALLAVRLFSAAPHIVIGGDQCKYLVLARHFPWHRLDNDSLFLQHPPLLGWVIGLFALVLPLVTAGLVATICVAVCNAIALWHYGKHAGITAAGLMVGLLWLSLDRGSAAYDTHVSRVPLMLLSMTLALWAFERWLSSGSESGDTQDLDQSDAQTQTSSRRRRRFITALLCNLTAHLVTDQALMLLPCQVLLWLLAPRSRSAIAQQSERVIRTCRTWKEMFCFTLASGLVMLCWPVVRLIVFATHEDYPAGMDGIVEVTRPIPWAGVLQPNLLPNARAHYQVYFPFSWSAIDPWYPLHRVTQVLLLPQGVTIGLLALLVSCAFAERTRRRSAVKWLALSLLLIFPAWIGMPEWYGLGFVLPMTLLLAEGGMGLLSLMNRVVNALRGLLVSDGALARGFYVVMMFASLAIAIVWVQPRRAVGHNVFQPEPGSHFLLSRTPVTRGQDFLSSLSALPRGSVLLSPVGLTPEVIYLSGQQNVALPFDPEKLDWVIEQYHATHVVLHNDVVSVRGRTDRVDRAIGAATARSVQSRSERFKLVQKSRETYPAVFSPNTFWLYEVLPLQSATTMQSESKRGDVAGRGAATGAERGAVKRAEPGSVPSVEPR
jgi:hypothetical protein